MFRAKKKDHSDEEEIILLAKKGAKAGTLTSEESDLVTNSLKLDKLYVRDIMTPRTVVTSLDESLTVSAYLRNTQCSLCQATYL